MQGLFQSVKLFASVCVTPHANVSRFVGDVTGISDPLRLMFDSLDLAFAAIAGGYSGGRNGCCQEEAHDEPWGRCPGMRPMRKWLFGGLPQSV